MEKFKIGITGNPNSGKSTIFNELTGAKQMVGNWPGVTVERKTGYYTHDKYLTEVIDTPGIYSISATTSLDEKVARDFLISKEADVVVNIVDASNLTRNLYLTTQLIEMKQPLIVALNMMDTAAEKRLEIDINALSEKLGCPVIPMVATQKIGIKELKNTIISTFKKKSVPAIKIKYPAIINEGIDELADKIHLLEPYTQINRKWLAIKLLEDDDQAEQMVDKPSLSKAILIRNLIEKIAEKESDTLIVSSKYEFINHIIQDVVKNRGTVKESITDRIDRIVLDRFWGIPLFLMAVYVMFVFTINLGGVFIDFLDQFTGIIFIDGLNKVLESVNAPEWFNVIVADGIGGAVQTITKFIPPVGLMFIFLSVLEDSGYMARAVFVMDRFMRCIGLPGKSFMPMMVGFGCNVPAIIGARTLNNDRDRILTIMMNPFISCGARMPVYALFATVFFPYTGQNVVFLLYLIGIVASILTGLMLRNTVLKGEISPLVMELPPYHMPTLKFILFRTYDRLHAFLFKAGKILFPIIIILSFLNSLGNDGSFGNENTANSALASISRKITPIFKPMGITEENWPATVGLFTGIFAKEAVVGTLDSLYNDRNREKHWGSEKNSDSTAFNLSRSSKLENLYTGPENFGILSYDHRDSHGINIHGTTDRYETVYNKEKVSETTSRSMITLFGSQAAAFAYMLFVLLYFPCSAAIAAIYRETNLTWTIFAGCWTTFVAWFTATTFYQTATFTSHPSYSLVMIILNITMLCVILTVLYRGSIKQ